MTTHCRSAREKCRPFWIEGRATLTIVASRMTMNCATQTTMSVIHGLSVRPGEAEVRVGEAMYAPFRLRGLAGPLSLANRIGESDSISAARERRLAGRPIDGPGDRRLGSPP